MKAYTFETDRLLLRPASIDDAAFVLELLNSPKWLQYIGDRNVKNVADAERYIEERMLPQVARLGYGNFMVLRKSDQVKLGFCGLYDREGIEGVDIGFSFLPAFEGKGYAFESSNRLKNAAFKEFGLSQIAAITLEENVASRRLLEKLGLIFVKYIHLPDDEEELMYYELKAASVSS